ncbi:MAG TPA: 4Fe-4S dicluster domain-containing protein [Methylomirabilota bacterium]|nr:4Fe-4S dicluster domain-containing protein [Methylomirabilota bacterium]
MSEGPAADAARPEGPEVSRRGLLKTAGPIVAFIALEAIGGLGASKPSGPIQVKGAEGVIYPDPTLCIGCLTCEVRCSQVHKAQGLSDVPRIRIFNDPATKVDPVVQAAYPDRGKFHQEPCLQCPTAECLYVCPVDALQVDPKTGARFINEDKCVTCGRCNEACIFPVSSETTATNQLVFNQHSRITYDPDKDVFAKCDLCYWREGGPACVESCPINVRIRQGVIKVENGRMCLSAPASTPETWDKLRAFQTFEGSPAQGKA